MEKNLKLFCFGFGQVAKYFVRNLIKKNLKFDLVTTNTSKTCTKYIDDHKYKSYFFLDDKFDNHLLKELDSSNKVLISVPPKNQKDVVIKTFSKDLKKSSFDWITYLSSTSVYGDKKGEWVDEKTIPEPSSLTGYSRLNAETAWLQYYKNFNLPVQIFRLSGIYSLENNIIKRLKMGTVKIVKNKNHFFSRIHIEDIAEILMLSLKKFNSGEIYNISDNYPCSNEELTKYAANLIKIDIPEKTNLDEIKNEMLKDFYKSSKKVSNQKMKNFFSYKLKYPTYIEGLSNIKNHQV
jgi:NAD dependent epimerase/dehydratase family enzyme